MTTITGLLTYDDLLAMPDDGKRYELIDGELIDLTSPTVKHQFVIIRLGTELHALVTRLALGWVLTAPLDVVLSPTNVVQPDLIFVARERRHILRPNFVDGPPNLVIEVLSPSTRHRDETRKRDLYAAFGVDELWLVDPLAETIRVHALENGRYALVNQDSAMLRSPVLLALELDLETLFAAVP